MTNNIKYSDVQNAFKEGATPNEDDYQKLITLARVGGLALGATDAAPTTLSPGVGLEIKDNKLAVKAAEKQGLSVSANGVGVEADMASVAVTGDGLEVMLKKDGGLSKEGGLHVVAGPGLKTDDKGLQVALAQNSGLATAGGLAVAADGKAGLEINKENKLAVRLSQKNKFLEAKDDGLAINDDGIKSIRDTLKAVSIEALNQAIVGTEHGFMKDTYKPEEGSVEAQIATALNDAYKNGLCPDTARYALERELRKFVGDKSQWVGLVATSPNNDDVGLYDTTGNQFSKGAIACFFVDADGLVKMPDIDGANISLNTSGAYAFVGRVNDKGVQDKDGKYYTTNALMVIVGPVKGGRGFAGCIGAWNLEALKDNKNSWSNTPAPDPLQFKKGYAAMEDMLVRPTIKAQPESITIDKKDAVDLSKCITPAEGEGPVYYLAGAGGENLVDINAATGKLTPTGRKVGTATVLVVQAHKTTGRISTAVELTVEVKKGTPPYKTVSPKIDFIPLAGLDLNTVEFFKGDTSPGPLAYELVTGTTEASVAIVNGKLTPTPTYKQGGIALKVTTPETDVYEKKTFEYLFTAYVASPGTYTADLCGTTVYAEAERKEEGLTITFHAPSSMTQGLQPDKNNDKSVYPANNTKPFVVTSTKNGGIWECSRNNWDNPHEDHFLAVPRKKGNPVRGITHVSFNDQRPRIDYSDQRPHEGFDINDIYDLEITEPFTSNLGTHDFNNGDGRVIINLKFG